MRLIPSLPFGAPPCAVIAGRGIDDEGFVETSNHQHGVDPPVRVSVAAVREMARLIGYPSPAETLALKAEAEDLQLRLEASEAEKVELHRELDAVDGLVKSSDWVLRKAPGRPKKAAA